jgi:hypothetical protein
MKRRDFVKGLAAAPIAMMTPQVDAARIISLEATPGASTAASSKPNPADGTSKLLNILVHGLFAIVLDRSGKRYGGNSGRVRLLAPWVAPHVYRAQSFKPSGAAQGITPCWNPEYSLSASASDSVTLTKPHGLTSQLKKTHLGDTLRLVVDVEKHPDVAASAYWTIDLPLPDDIWPLRATPFNYFLDDGNVFGTYRADEVSSLEQIPIIYVLTYQLAADEKATFSFGGSSKTIEFDSNGIERLHFYAEPPTDVNQATCANDVGHLNNALNALDNLFTQPLTLQFYPSVDPCNPLSFVASTDQFFKDHPSVLPCEQLSLGERSAYHDQCPNVDTKTIEEQYKEYLSFKKTIQELLREDLMTPFEREKTSNARDTNSLHLDKQRSTVVVPTAASTKPPSNCMSMVAITP